MRPFPTAPAGAILAAVAIALGAFGAHALGPHLTPARLDDFETGARYLMYAALALLALGASGRPQRGAPWLALGAMVFCLSLVALALTGQRWLGALTPLGGVLMILGLLLAALDGREG